MVCWKSTIDNPRDFEKGLIELFVSKFNKLPFANLVN